MSLPRLPQRKENNMATDALLAFQTPLVTKTGTFSSTGLDLVTGTPRRGLKCRVIYKNASTSSGAGSVTFRVTESTDNSTFTGIYQSTEATITLSTTAVSGEIYIDRKSTRLNSSHTVISYAVFCLKKKKKKKNTK